MAALPPPPPRLQGRLTAELVLGSPQGFNAVKDYELDLRGARNTPQRAPACCSPVPRVRWLCNRRSWRTDGLSRLPTLNAGRDPPARAGHKLGTIENLAVSQVSVRPAALRRLAARHGADGSLGAETAALSAPYVTFHRCV
jgi:hypothetical protein